MTLIACANNTMVADSQCFSGGMRFAVPRPKIIRAPDGSLAGAAGASVQVDVWHRWVLDGMNFSQQPELPKLDEDEKNDELYWLWLRSGDGKLFAVRRFDAYEMSQPNSIGYRDACWVWHGAYDACQDPVQALRVTLARCSFVGGEPQVEHL